MWMGIIQSVEDLDVTADSPLNKGSFSCLPAFELWHVFSFVCLFSFFFFQYLQTWNKILALLRTQTCQPLEGSSHHQSFWVSSLPTHPADLETCQCPKLYKPISYNRSLSISLCLCVFLSIYLPPIPLVIFLWRVLIEQEAPKSWQPEQIHMYIHVYMAWKSIKWNLGKLPITFQLMLRLHKM